MAPRKAAERGINKQYFYRLLGEQQLTTRTLAPLLGLDQPSIVRSFNGKRKFTNSEVSRLAQVLHAPLEDVLTNLGVVVPPMRPKVGGTVPVTGYIKQSIVVLGKAPGPQNVPAPPNEPAAGLTALRCSDESVFDGAYFYYRPSDSVQANAISRLSVCVLTDGRVVVSTPRPTGRDSYTLRDLSGRVLVEEAWLTSAAPVIWIKTA